MSFMAEYGDTAADNGYRVIPIAPGTKRPGQYIDKRWLAYKGWTRHCQRDSKSFELNIWKRWPDAGVGIATGNVVGIDIDILDAEWAAKIEALARKIDVSGLELCVGEAGMVEVSTHPRATIVVACAVGAVGLLPTYRALEAGKDVALATKETLVMAGDLMVAQARARGGRLLPIDSEHCALHQCLDGRTPADVRRLVLTASGGPFRQRPAERFSSITGLDVD